ncbi:DUF2829 domain-containing protein [Clostridium tyrobutyricum]|uniref:DUF2829 domain-containing protein n=1 Tax=Clostridium tyrobutyricum TaxID=1519 RepID=UPI001C3948A3|nr:DUF2829 domain-containing protein [Clostridium tyrobutyricum]MBV4424935.1 DUF2829 domain-containing protein [Clostridium tyrobutyricum]
MENLTICDFGYAIKELKEGFKVRRQGWNGKGMFLTLFKPQVLIAKSEDGRVGEKEWLIPGDIKLEIQKTVYLKTVQDALVPWTPSQTDMLATDWERA